VTYEKEKYPAEITKVNENKKIVNVKCDDGDTVEDVDFDDIEAEPEKKDKKKDKGKGKKKDKDKKGKKNKCPGGGTFGKDTDELAECNDCPIWDDCDDA